MDGLCGSHSIQIVTDQLLHSDSIRCFPSVPTDCHRYRDISPASANQPSAAVCPAFSPSPVFPSSYRVVCGSTYFFPVVRDFCWYQLVFYENCCICRCILDASMEGDLPHVHPVLHHLVNSLFSIIVYLTTNILIQLSYVLQ